MDIKCTTCNKIYTPGCDYRQGRCPHHPGLAEQIISDPHKARFFNLAQSINNLKRKTTMEIQPKDTSRNHFYVSLAKSLIRIVAGGAFMLGHVAEAGALLILAEVLGIAEEIV
jgi:hypothetical protein